MIKADFFRNISKCIQHEISIKDSSYTKDCKSVNFPVLITKDCIFFIIIFQDSNPMLKLVEMHIAMYDSMLQRKTKRKNVPIKKIQ